MANIFLFATNFHNSASPCQSLTTCIMTRLCPRPQTSR